MSDRKRVRTREPNSTTAIRDQIPQDRRDTEAHWRVQGHGLVRQQGEAGEQEGTELIETLRRVVFAKHPQQININGRHNGKMIVSVAI